jgi:hypothetical protein
MLYMTHREADGFGGGAWKLIFAVFACCFGGWGRETRWCRPYDELDGHTGLFGHRFFADGFRFADFDGGFL